MNATFKKPNSQRIVITGIGTILPNTFSVDEFWKNLRNGESQVNHISHFDTSELMVKIASPLVGFDHQPFLSELQPERAKKYTMEILATMSALEQAKKDANLTEDDVDPARVGFVGSSSRGPLAWWHNNFMQGNNDSNVLTETGSILSSLPGTAASMAAIYSNIQGLVTVISNACVGGHQVFDVAIPQLLSDYADVMYVGGYEFSVVESVLKLYSSPKSSVLSTQNEDPKTAMKPYDKKRDGFALGEGAVVLCMERLDKALARGATIYSEVLGSQCVNEAAHATRMDITGQHTANLFATLLNKIDRPIDDVDYFCGHGTATYYNDLTESRALKSLYSGWKTSDLPPIGSIKPIFGHCLGASGIINVAASSLMLHNQCLCPTINLSDPEEECDHDHVSEGAREVDVNLIVSLAYAIGSQTSVVALGRCDA